jgi:hypothetical protein
MASQGDVRQIALALPGAEEVPGRFAFGIPIKGKLKGFAWVWMERITPKKPRVANPAVLAVRVANLVDKDVLISAEPKKYFTEPHYDGFPAVLVRLSAVRAAELRELLAEARRSLEPAKAARTAKTGKVARTVKTAETTGGRLRRRTRGNNQ